MSRVVALRSVIAVPNGEHADPPCRGKGEGKEELKLVLGFGSLGEFAKWTAALCPE